jgi:RNA polymerase sigma-70 factor (ECF subfamily)
LSTTLTRPGFRSDENIPVLSRPSDKHGRNQIPSGHCGKPESEAQFLEKHPAKIHAVKVNSVPDDLLGPAGQGPRAIARVSQEANESEPVNPEKELIRRAQSDDSWAIEQLIVRYQRRIYAIAYHMLSGDAEEAKDRTQEVFFQAFQKIKHFEGKASFYTWLYRIVINTCIDARRRRHRWQKIFFPWRVGKDHEEESAAILEDYPDTEKMSDPLATVSGQQLEVDVKKAMKMLSAKQRSIFQLKVFHEFSIKEIAEAMGLAEGTVKTHLFRATQVMQKQLKGWTEV